jgi:hypothetical protein
MRLRIQKWMSWVCTFQEGTNSQLKTQTSASLGGR